MLAWGFRARLGLRAEPSLLLSRDEQSQCATQNLRDVADGDFMPHDLLCRAEQILYLRIDHDEVRADSTRSDEPDRPPEPRRPPGSHEPRVRPGSAWPPRPPT